MMRRRVSGHERHIIRERIKSGVLIALCLCCAYLLVKVIGLQGVKSGSAPDIASNIRGTSDSSSRNVMKVYSVLTEPELITVNKNGAHTAISESDADYSKATEIVNEALKAAHEASAQSCILATMTEWQTALLSESVYMRYPCVRSSEFDARFYEIKNGELAKKIPEYTEVIITASKNDNVKVMLRDGDKVVSVNTVNSALSLRELTEKAYENARMYMFGFELKDNAEFAYLAENVEEYLAFPIEEYSAEKIRIDAPWEYKNSIEITKNTNLIIDLINVFGYNQNTIRRYMDGDGALVCVGETGTLRMCPDGMIEYRALDAETGVSLLPSGSTDSDNVYTMTSGLIGIMERIFELCSESAEMRGYKLRFTEMSKVDSGDGIVLGLDYFVDGNMLCIRDGHAIEASVKSGILTEMKMCVKTVERSGEFVSAGRFFDVVATNTQSGTATAAASVCYAMSDDGTEYLPIWKTVKSREASR